MTACKDRSGHEGRPWFIAGKVSEAYEALHSSEKLVAHCQMQQRSVAHLQCANGSAAGERRSRTDRSDRSRTEEIMQTALKVSKACEAQHSSES